MYFHKKIITIIIIHCKPIKYKAELPKRSMYLYKKSGKFFFKLSKKITKL